MTTLLIRITLLFMVVAIFSAGAYLIYRRDQQLKEFRANIRVGQMVRVLRPDGSTVRARIVVKNSDYHFVAIDIDTKVRHMTAASCIYKP